MNLEQAIAENSPTETPAVVAPTDAPPSTETPKVEEEDPRFASRFAALSRKEKAILEREKKIKEQEAELASLKKARENAKIDPLAFMQEHGLTFEQLTDHILNQGKPKELSLDEKLAGFKEEFFKELSTKAEEDKKRQAEEDGKRAIESYKAEIKKLVETKPDDFELIAASDAYDQVWEKIEAHFNETGEVLSVDKAAEAVENLLLQGYKDILGKTKKLSLAEAIQKSEDAANEVPAYDSGKTLTAPKTEAPTTLTNRQATQPAAVDNKLPSEDELRKRAIAMLKWKA